jgi:hypothetical protein
LELRVEVQNKIIVGLLAAVDAEREGISVDREVRFRLRVRKQRFRKALTLTLTITVTLTLTLGYEEINTHVSLHRTVC